MPTENGIFVLILNNWFIWSALCCVEAGVVTLFIWETSLAKISYVIQKQLAELFFKTWKLQICEIRSLEVLHAPLKTAKQ